MTPQQAGVSAEAVGKLVERWRKGANDKELTMVAGFHQTDMLTICADELEAALRQEVLATAPPEQAPFDPTLSTITWGRAHRAASAGALELSEDEVITCILDSLFPSNKVQILAADTTAAIKLASGPDGLTVQINRILQKRLAAHDQKVRREAFEEIALYLEVNHRDDDDAEWEACCNLPDAIRSLASPATAASKPEAGKGEK